jgi:Peptidase family M48
VGAALATTVGLQLPNSRTQEAQADRIGIELATLIPEMMAYYEDTSPRPVYKFKTADAG